jgi:hypothetical protein
MKRTKKATYDDVVAALGRLLAGVPGDNAKHDKGRKAAHDVLARWGVTGVRELPRGDYADVVRICDFELAKLTADADFEVDPSTFDDIEPRILLPELAIDRLTDIAARAVDAELMRINGAIPAQAPLRVRYEVRVSVSVSRAVGDQP